MSKINVKSKVEKIEVNDNGDYILLPLGDAKFVLAFYDMMEEVQKKIKGIKANSDDAPQDIRDELERMASVSDFLFEQTEKVFGEGTCRKVFGECRPGVIMFWEFFNEILPFLENYLKDYDSGFKK